MKASLKIRTHETAADQSPAANYLDLSSSEPDSSAREVGLKSLHQRANAQSLGGRAGNRPPIGGRYQSGTHPKNHSMTLISDRDYHTIGDGIRTQKPATNINSTINVSTIDGDGMAGETGGGMHATNMSTIASLTNSRPKHATLLLNNLTSTLPAYGGEGPSGATRHHNTHAYSSMSPGRHEKNRGHYRGKKGVSIGSTSLLNTSSLIHYKQQHHDGTTEATLNSIKPSLIGLHPQTSKAAHTILNQTLTAGESLLSRTVLSAEQLSLAPGGATSAG